jgi:hypothetical protein
MTIFGAGAPCGIDVFPKKAVLQFDRPFADLGNWQIVSWVY